MTDDEIRELEEAFYRACPAAETRTHKGWRLRFTGGVSRRANSVYPLTWSGRNAEEDIRAVEGAYRGKGLKPAFYVSPLGRPAELDKLLSARGYHAEGHAHVQTLNLTSYPNSHCYDMGWTINAMSAAWAECYLRDNPNSRDQAGRVDIMRQVTEDRAYISAAAKSDDVGCGMAVLSGEWVIVQGMRTVERYRGKGVGTDILIKILSWGAEQGAQKAALQVETGNPAALRLYGKAGFTTAYDYHYRIRGRA